MTDEPATRTPGTAVPDTAVPDTAVPGTAGRDTTQPDTAVPGTAGRDTTQPDTAVPGTAVPLLPRHAQERLLFWSGLVVATGLGAVSAVYEAFLAPLTWHGVPVPIALLFAVGGNAALAWFTLRACGRVTAVLLPGGAWVAVMLVAAGRTTEGDLVLTSNDWVGLTTMFGGAAVFAASTYWLVLRTRPVAR